MLGSIFTPISSEMTSGGDAPKSLSKKVVYGDDFGSAWLTIANASPLSSAVNFIREESISIPSFCNAKTLSNKSSRCLSISWPTICATPCALDDTSTALWWAHWEKEWAWWFTTSTECITAFKNRCIGCLLWLVLSASAPIEDSSWDWGIVEDMPLTWANGANRKGNPSAKCALASRLIGLLFKYSQNIPFAMSGRGKTSITRPSSLISKLPFFRQVNTSSVPLAQHVGLASNSGGADCPHEQLLEFSLLIIFCFIWSSAIRSLKDELIMTFFISSVNSFQSLSRLFLMTSIDNCMLVLINSVRSKNPPMVLVGSSPGEGIFMRCS